MQELIIEFELEEFNGIILLHPNVPLGWFLERAMGWDIHGCRTTDSPSASATRCLLGYCFTWILVEDP